AGIGSGQSCTYKKITISGFSTIYALGGKYGAGIGGGKTALCGQIHIRDSALVTAQGGNFGAGIGTGAKNAPDFAPLAGEIYIYNNASVRAAGGKDGAGIGGGLFASGAKVVVSDTASVDAYSNLEVELDSSSAKKKADYTAVEAALAKVPKNLKEYTDDSVKILKAAMKEIVYDLPATDQARVDNYAAAVERAISILVKKTIERKVSVSTQNYKSGEAITVKWEGATSPKDRIIILKRSHLPTDTEIDPDLKVSYGTPLLSAYCKKNGKLAKKGSVKLSVTEDDLLYSLGFNGLPGGKYTAYLCLEDEDAPVALANFAVHGTAYLEADYSEVEAALSKLPKDSSLYTEKSWNALQKAIDSVKYNLTAKDQTKVDGYAKSIRDAIEALVLKESVDTEKDVSKEPSVATVAFIHPKESDSTYTLTDLAKRDDKSPALLLLAESAGKPESFGWGLIPTESPNVETAPKGSIVSAINYVVEAKNVSVSKDEKFDTLGLDPASIGAGAGCNMQGSLRVAETALINGTVTSATITLEYGASIGTLHYDYIAGETFVLPEEVRCPGYIFKGWSTDEGGKSAASGDFSVSGDLT
ncbi:MAG: InlB B-repeat-containing protein, partial [Clostridia bacterium]|nr:InlB B-repeat-containing protein [Clostridia bacterium]